MKTWPLNIVGYNPLKASNAERNDDIHAELENFDIILMAGTGYKQPSHVKEMEQLMHYNFKVIKSGYCKSQHSNKSCGVSLSMGKRFKNAKVFPPVELKGPCQGRGLGVRIKAGYYDLAPLALYYPPAPQASAARCGPSLQAPAPW